MDPVGAFIIAVFVLIGGVRGWWDSARARLTGDTDTLDAWRAQERQRDHELRMAAQQQRHVERMAGRGYPSFSESVGAGLGRRLATPRQYDELGPLGRWWWRRREEWAANYERRRQETDERMERGKQWWRDWANRARERARQYWEDRQRRRDIPDAEWWEDEPAGPESPAEPRDDQSGHRCATCGKPLTPPRMRCSECLGQQRPEHDTEDPPGSCSVPCRGCGKPTTNMLGRCFDCQQAQRDRAPGEVIDAEFVDDPQPATPQSSGPRELEPGWPAWGPGPQMDCPDCHGKGCATCGNDGQVPAWLADPTVNADAAAWTTDPDDPPGTVRAVAGRIPELPDASPAGTAINQGEASMTTATGSTGEIYNPETALADSQFLADFGAKLMDAVASLNAELPGIVSHLEARFAELNGKVTGEPLNRYASMLDEAQKLAKAAKEMLAEAENLRISAEVSGQHFAQHMDTQAGVKALLDDADTVAAEGRVDYMELANN